MAGSYGYLVTARSTTGYQSAVVSKMVSIGFSWPAHRFSARVTLSIAWAMARWTLTSRIALGFA